MQKAAELSVETLPAKKLLQFITKDDLVNALGEDFLPIRKLAFERDASLTATFIKDRAALNDDFMQRFRHSPEGTLAFQKYMQSYERLTKPESKIKGIQVRKLMSEPRHGFMGCIATKVEPSDFKDCVRNYDKEEYQDIDLVPSRALKQSVYSKTDNQLLAPNPKVTNHISYLPRGLRAYMLANPVSYQEYIKERKAELKLLKRVKKNFHKEQHEGQQPPSFIMVDKIEPIERIKRPRSEEEENE